MRSTSSTASGSSLTMCCAASMARRKRGKLADAQHLARLERMQRQLQRGGEGQRAFRTDQQPRQIFAARRARRRRQHVDVVAADTAQAAWGSARRFPPPRPRRARAGAGSGRRHWPACRRRDCPAPRRSGGACRRPGWRRSRARCRPSARSGSISNRRSCCRPCRRWCSAHASRDRPGRTVCAARNAVLRWPSTTPGSTARCVPSASTCSDAAQVLRTVDDQRAIDGLAALAGAAAARQDGDALLACDRQRRGDVVDRPRHDHAERLDLVDRRVGGVTAAIGAIEQHLARDVAAQAFGQVGVAGDCHSKPRPRSGRGRTRQRRG